MSSATLVDHAQTPATPHVQGHPALLALTVGALGVVFGDIGTSPLYAFHEALGQTAKGGIHRPRSWACSASPSGR